MPVSPEKTVWADTVIIFLGFLKDSVNQIIAIPIEKISKAINMIEHMLSKESKPAQKRKMTVLQLQKICGFLNFLSQVILPGRAFTQRLYCPLQNSNLQQHHHIKISDKMFRDLRMWEKFVKNPSIYCRSFMDFTKDCTADQINFYTDASRNFALGCSGYCERLWFQLRWGKDVAELEPSIQYLELYALTIGILSWLHCFCNRRIIVFSDNQGVVNVINSSSLGCKNCMILVRIIVLHSLIHNVSVFAHFVLTKNNEIADSLSRFQSKRLKKTHLTFDQESMQIPSELLPMSKIWVD